MFYTVKKLLEIIKLTKISNLFFLTILILINSFFEILSIGILIPLVSIIVDADLYNNFKNLLTNDFFLNFSFMENLDKKSFILYLTFITFLLYFVKFSVNILYSWILNTTKMNYENLIGVKLLNNFSTTSNLFFFNIPSSKLMYDMTTRVAMVASSIINISNILVEAIVFFVIYLFILYKFTTQSIYLLIIIILLFGFVYFFFRNMISKWSFERGDGGDKRSKNLLDFFNGIREVIIYSSHQFFLNEFSKNNRIFLNPQRKILFLNSLPKMILEMIFLFTFLGVFYFYVFNDYDYNSILISMSVVLVLVIRMLPSFNRLIFHFNQFKYCSESILKVHKIILSTKHQELREEKIDFGDNIELKHINFNYPGKKSIFENLSLKIQKNSRIGIVGETGSGKSTLVDLIISLIKPTEGSIVVDGKKIENNRNWIKNISYVSQRIFLFNSSLRHNICFKEDKEEIDQIKFNKVVELCDLDELINKSKEKEFYQVGENGKNVSGGQRQRIGIARALYKDSQILILDESTNALDDISEKKIIDNISKLQNKTIILITHNHNNIKNFDQTFKIDDKTLKKFNL